MKVYNDKRLGKVLVLNRQSAAKLSNRLPDIKIAELNDDLCAVRLSIHVVNELEDMGHDTPSITTHYGWPGRFEYYEHQKDTAEFLALNWRAWCTNGMRSGKTSSGALAADVLESCKDITKGTKILVLCPVNVMTTAWYREMKVINRKRKYYVCKDSVAKAKKAMEDGVDTLIMNHDKISHTAREIDEWLGEKGLVIVDEAHKYRNHKTDLFQNLLYLIDITKEESKHRGLFLLTGTPIPNAPTDMYWLQRQIDPSRVPSSFNKWRSETMVSYSIYLEKNKGGRKQELTKWRTRDGADQLVADAMQPCIRYRTVDCIDMPEKAYSYYETQLSPAQKKVLKELSNGYAASHDGEIITAANAAVRTSKMLQVQTGVAYTEDDPVVIGAPDKFKCLLDLIQQNEGKTIVFCIFKEAQRWLKAELAKKKIRAEIVNGDTTPTEKVELQDKFQTKRTPHVLILHPQCEGMTLTKAYVSAWWGPPESNLQWTQANERMMGPDGVPRLVAMLYSSYLEKQRYETRINQDEKQTRTLDIYAEALREFGTKRDIEKALGKAG